MTNIYLMWLNFHVFPGQYAEYVLVRFLVVFSLFLNLSLSRDNLFNIQTKLYLLYVMCHQVLT